MKKHLGKKIKTKEDAIKVILETIEELEWIMIVHGSDKARHLIKKLKVSVGDADE